ncbi:MAG TPA: YidC/Oxa1 family membrane protein insertase [Candidatus Saccharimonadales bacterium]|nr:YidC/Oxa1 family membrane protein insertase [Candidatus Saccharimonadales bacterium]
MAVIFNLIFIQPILNILIAIYQLLLFLHVPYALGFAIIGLTVLVRLIIHPSMQKGLQQQKKMQELAPHIAKIKETHKGDMAKQNAAQAELFKEHGVNPLSGCLPLLVQLPLVIGLFQTLSFIAHSNSLAKINSQVYFAQFKLLKIWNTDFFGIPLEKSPHQLVSKMGIAILLIVLISALLQFVQAKMVAPPKPEIVENSPKKNDMSSAMQSQMLLFLPIIIGYSSYSLPIGVSLYWNTFSIFAIIQQYRTTGWGGIVQVFSRNK